MARKPHDPLFHNSDSTDLSLRGFVFKLNSVKSPRSLSLGSYVPESADWFSTSLVFYIPIRNMKILLPSDPHPLVLQQQLLHLALLSPGMQLADPLADKH